jgi:anaerobic magnesium-protoporphyrin IX monomethyl ester cyclase
MLNNKDVTVVLLCIEEDSLLVKKQFTPPFGLLVAASVLRDKSINVIIKHLIFKDDIEQLLIQTCGNAFAVGFTTMTSANLLATIKATRLVKSLGLVTFWGGTHATL